MEFDNSNRAIYLQIADLICDKMLSGEYKADSRIPSVRELAVTLAVNVNTVMRAYDFMAERGIVYNKRGMGYYAAADCRSKVSDMRLKELVDSRLPAIFRELHLLQVSPDGLASMYKYYINNNK